MAEGVVDPFEIVQIHHGQAEWLMLEQQTIDAFIEETAVVEAGQLVEVGLLARLVIILAHLRQLGIDVSELAHPSCGTSSGCIRLARIMLEISSSMRRK